MAIKQGLNAKRRSEKHLLREDKQETKRLGRNLRSVPLCVNRYAFEYPGFEPICVKNPFCGTPQPQRRARQIFAPPPRGLL